MKARIPGFKEEVGIFAEDPAYMDALSSVVRRLNLYRISYHSLLPSA